MDKNQLSKLFDTFLINYDEKSKTEIWQKQSQIFRDFWNKKILKETHELTIDEVDEIIRILDIHAKGNSRLNNAVAKTMINQRFWRKIFSSLRYTKLPQLLNNLFLEEDDNKKIQLINELYNVYGSYHVGLTTKGGNALNTILFAYNPQNYLSIVSLNHRNRIIDFFQFSGGPNKIASHGENIILTNRAIINGFKVLNINNTARTISDFLNSIKSFWNFNKENSTIVKY